MQIGFLGLLTLIFVTAKLFGAITWSWWLVFAPMWIGIPVALLIIVVLGLVAITANK